MWHAPSIPIAREAHDVADPKRILVRAPNWAGDVVMATPGLRALRARFPVSRIDVALPEPLAPLLHGLPHVDAVLSLRRPPGRGLAGLVRQARHLRESGPYDLGISLPDSFSSALLLWLTGARPVVGYRGQWRRALLGVAPPAPRDAQGGRLVPRERHVLGLIEALGGDGSDTGLELRTTPDERERARKALERCGLAEVGGRLALLAPGASFGPSKLWPAESFAAVGDGLAHRGFRVAVVGGPAERALARRVATAMRGEAVVLAGELDLGAFKAVVERAALLVCNDAGARHVAVAFGVPAVVLMGPTALEKTGLNLERVRVLTAEADCRPCYRRHCPIDHRCMTGIPPERVLEAAAELGAFP